MEVIAGNIEDTAAQVNAAADLSEEGSGDEWMYELEKMKGGQDKVVAQPSLQTTLGLLPTSLGDGTSCYSNDMSPRNTNQKLSPSRDKLSYKSQLTRHTGIGSSSNPFQYTANYRMGSSEQTKEMSSVSLGATSERPGVTNNSFDDSENESDNDVRQALSSPPGVVSIDSTSKGPALGDPGGGTRNSVPSVSNSVHLFPNLASSPDASHGKDTVKHDPVVGFKRHSTQGSCGASHSTPTLCAARPPDADIRRREWVACLLLATLFVAVIACLAIYVQHSGG
eukprot:TRINITY_DN51022_c0_g1_i1.p1 TRINITY_DN51022_c0_g1~~TRINITY_DN51022_c0_g1_i1.p1  ORF type:complete len:281 (+),score=42.29 TRINITY_DN51022_c0_g1_i1:218-1060(+)